jgi:hypothetical protein
MEVVPTFMVARRALRIASLGGRLGAPNVSWKRAGIWNALILLGALSLAPVDGSRAQSVRPDSAGSAPITRTGSWSAATASGLTLMGTWTATLDPAGTVTGTWELFDAQGNTRAEGGWSAAKSPDRWTGAWRAVVSGRTGEYSGTWTGVMDGKPDARLADLFAKALQSVVNGNWRVGAQSGAWAIRTFN